MRRALKLRPLVALRSRLYSVSRAATQAVLFDDTEVLASPVLGLQARAEQADEITREYLEVDDNGQTELHLAVSEDRGQSSMARIKRLIMATSREDVALMSRMTDNRGLVPADYLDLSVDALIARVAFSPKCVGWKSSIPTFMLGAASAMPLPSNQEVQLALYQLMVEYSTNAFSEQLDPNVIAARYSAGSNKKLAENLAIGCAAVNHARSVLSNMVTHPDANNWSQEKATHYNKLLASLRVQREERATKTFIGGQEEGFNIGWHDAYLRYAYNDAEEHGVGACGEACFVAMYHILNAAPYKFAEIYSLEKGNHSYIVIGRNPYSCDADLMDPNFNADDSVVVGDILTGDVYPASQIPKRLVGYKQVTMNVVDDNGVKREKTSNVLVSYSDALKPSKEGMFSTHLLRTMPGANGDKMGDKYDQYYPLAGSENSISFMQ